MASPKIGGVDLLTLNEVLEYLHNYFFNPRDNIHAGDYTITDGHLSGADDILQEGQYYLIVGSVFNGGVHQWGDTDPEHELTDEAFHGAIRKMAVPPTVLDLVGEISTWKTKYQDAAQSPLSSESFGGYSYTKASGITSDGGSGGWKAVFAGRLSKWRKL